MLDHFFKNKKTLLIVVGLMITFVSYTQSFNYQAVVRNSTGDPITNQSIGVQVQILEGVAPDTVVYTETHTVTSSAQGVISLSVGAGTTSDTFNTVNWSQQNQWIGIAVDITGGTTYISLGTTKLQQVPYALYATTSGDKTFTTTNNVTSNAPGDITTDDFVFGSTQLGDTGNEDNDRRLFFDKSKGAFRAGIAEGNEWDDAQVGENSMALGYRSVASGNTSIALGRFANALSDESISIGHAASGNALRNISIGYRTYSGSKEQITIGSYNTLTFGDPNNWVSTDRLFVIGNGDADNGTAPRSDALVMLKNGNTTLNGQLTIDGDNQGTGTSYTLPAQDGTANQVMTTDGAGNVSWAAVGGAFSTTSNVTSNASGDITTDDFVFGSTQLDNDTATTTDDFRFFYDKSKGAFRAGRVFNADWDEANLGQYSIALGRGNLASDNASFAVGESNTSSGSSSMALGEGNEATNYAAFAAGYNSIASGDSSVAMGDGSNAAAQDAIAIGESNVASAISGVAIGNRTTADSYSQISLGINNTTVSGNTTQFIATDRLLVIGNGTSSINKSDALTILKNGNTTLNGQLTIDGDNQGSGASYTLPAQDGTANQVMTTDGAGNVSWIDYGLEAVSSPTFSSGWENYSVAHGTGFEDARYYVDNGRVYLGGLIRKTSGINAGEIMLTLPIGYRPLKQRIFTVSTEAGIVRIDVAANGTVIYNAPAYNGGQNWVSLDGISFRID